MKAKQIGSNEILRIVLRDEKMCEMFGDESAKRRLNFGSQINGGSKLGGKKVGVQRFHNEQLAIARSIYYKFNP
jgi:hypothetical protein